MEVNLIFRVSQGERASSLQHALPLQAEPAWRRGLCGGVTLCLSIYCSSDGVEVQLDRAFSV